jgi:glycosyltransferase involved in cell wall biosynthesis
LILDALIHSKLFKNENFELLVVGTNLNRHQGNVRFLGRIPNDQLPKYYQMSDYYLFSTLWHEGFPLSLSEAIACGVKCVASRIDPLPDIFMKFGNVDFVDNPNIVKSWIDKLESIVDNCIEIGSTDMNLVNYELSMNTWCDRLNEILMSEEKLINNDSSL